MSLPTTNAEKTAAPITSLLTQPDAAHRLPPAAQSDIHELERLHGLLVRGPAPHPAKGPEGTDAHHAVQVAWGATEAWLGAFARFDDAADPAVPRTRKLHDLLFGEGTGFLMARVQAEWIESERRTRRCSARSWRASSRPWAARSSGSRSSRPERERAAAHLTQPTQPPRAPPSSR